MGLENYEISNLGDQGIQILKGDPLEKANVDSQVATAKQYPRDVRRSLDNSMMMATLDTETAQSCGYALPRAGKPIMGPSVHLAKIIASNWGNMRTEAKVVNITDKQIISRGVAWDLESNLASCFEVRRSIIGSSGKRFSDDMITVTGNAANAIAYRNAVFAVIPKPITDKVYQAAQQKITGDLSEAKALAKRRTGAIQFFFTEYGVSEEDIIKLCGKQKVEQIGVDEIALLLGIQQSLKDGDTTVDQVFKKEKTVEDKKKELKGNQSPKMP